MLARMLASAPMIPTPANITIAPVTRPAPVTGKKSPYPTVVIVTSAHHRASPPVVMLASVARLSNCRTSTLHTTSTITAAMIEMNAAYCPR